MESDPQRAKDEILFVGSEITLHQLLQGSDVEPLLEGFIKAGVACASLTDEKGQVLWRAGHGGQPGRLPPPVVSGSSASPLQAPGYRVFPLLHEGEPIGFLYLAMPDSHNEVLSSPILSFGLNCLNLLIHNSARRILTANIHTTVVNQSYAELLEINRQLTHSERRYKELADQLEKKVEERTAGLKRAHARLLQQEKMASVGQLAAGLAHEINNPISFILSNLSTFRGYTKNLEEMLKFYRSRPNGASGAASPHVQSGATEAEAERLYEKLEIDYILDDAYGLIDQSREGGERIRAIVANLKGFSHIDESGNKPVEVNAEIEKALGVLAHEIKKSSATILRNYGETGAIQGNPGLLAQAFLSVLLNGLQSRAQGVTLSIKTYREGDKALVCIADDGMGIDPAIHGRIFEPFFTTRGVGKGTGMGLAVCYEIISAHQGSIEVRSEAGKGSTFILALPVRGGHHG